MIHFVTGKPRAGKGLVVMKEIIECLVGTDMVVITDLPIRMGPWLRPMGRNKYKSEKGLLAHLQETYGNTFDAEKRVKILAEEQAVEFYLQRQSVGGEWIQLPCERDKQGRVTSFSTGIPCKPTLYVTDECWRTFGARNWQNTAQGVQYYAAQHAKMSDRWLLVSQHTKQIDTALRQLAQDFWLVKNHANLSLGMFQRPALFTVAIYESAPNNGVMQEPMSTKPFRIDKAGVGGCYDTAAGSGVVGQSGADINQKRRGLPFGVLIGAGLVVLAFLIMSPKLLKMGAKKAFGMGEKPMPVQAAPVGVPAMERVVDSPVSVKEAQKAEDEVVLFVGMHTLQGRLVVWLSDGSEMIASSFRDKGKMVVVDGVEYLKKKSDFRLEVKEPEVTEVEWLGERSAGPSVHVFGQRPAKGEVKQRPLNDMRGVQ